MGRQRTYVLLALGVFLALGLALGDDGGAVDAQDSEGEEPTSVECDEGTDVSCDETKGSGAGPLEDYCDCPTPVSDPPEGLQYLMPYRNWLACVERCVEDIANHNATPDPEIIGTSPLKIGRNDGEPLQGVCGYDNIAGIQGWHLTADADNLIAKFRRMTSTPPSPNGGSIYFKINGREFTADWPSGRMMGSALDALIISRLEANNFEVEETADFILVTADLTTNGPGITDFNIRYTTGTKLNALYVALEPPNTENRLLCLTGGLGE